MKIQEVNDPASTVPVALLPDDPLHTRFLNVLLAIWRAMTSSRRGAIGSAIVGFFILVGLFGPFFMPLSGESSLRIIFHEVFPNEIGLVVAGFVSTTIYVVLTWATRLFPVGAACCTGRSKPAR